MLIQSGYPEIASIVASHMKLDEYDTNHITEKTIVFLADKLVKGDKVVTIEERFKNQFENAYIYETEIDLIQEIQEKYNQAIKVKNMVFDILEMK